MTREKGVDPDSRIFQGDNVPRPEVPASHAVEDDVDPYAFRLY